MSELVIQIIAGLVVSAIVAGIQKLLSRRR